jgi:D-glycero-D-manno-heptose 1,7-bisphosphate phosphatase
MTSINIQAPTVDKNWTLFLDRDGVINVESVGSYITSWEEFKFCDGALEAIQQFSEIFGRIVVVTNQRGVGRGIMSFQSLREINANMTDAIAKAGGKIDKIYACTAVASDDHNRKPNTGMASQAREDFPEIDYKRSIMVGNSLSDMEFGKKLSMHTIFLTTKHEPFQLPHDLIDEQHPSLLAMAKALKVVEMA